MPFSTTRSTDARQLNSVSIGRQLALSSKLREGWDGVALRLRQVAHKHPDHAVALLGGIRVNTRTLPAPRHPPPARE